MLFVKIHNVCNTLLVASINVSLQALLLLTYIYTIIYVEKTDECLTLRKGPSNNPVPVGF